MLRLRSSPLKDQAPPLIREYHVPAALSCVYTPCSTDSGFMSFCSKPGPKKARTDQWSCPENPLPVFCLLFLFFCPLSFLSGRLSFTPRPNLILHPPMSQIKTATKAEHHHEAQMKVNLRDVSVDKTLLSSPCFVGRNIFRATQT